MKKILILALSLFLGGTAQAEDTIRLIVGYAAGGSADQNARLLASEMSKVLHKNIVVENKLGAAGIVASQYLAKAPADGSVLMVGSNSVLAINKGLYNKLPYDPEKDFALVGGISASPLVLVVSDNVHSKTVKELATEANTLGQPLTMGSSGNGSIPHIAGSYISREVGVPVMHVPFNGNAPSVIALMSKTIDIIYDTLPSSIGNIKAGKYKALGITSDQRFPLLPDVPTLAEQGYPNLTANAWFGLVAPAGTPKPIIDELNKALNTVLKKPEVNKKFLNMGAITMSGTPEDFQRFVKSEIDRWVPETKRLGLKVD